MLMRIATKGTSGVQLAIASSKHKRDTTGDSPFKGTSGVQLQRRHRNKHYRKTPSDQAITHSAQVRFATNIHYATHFAGWRMSCDYTSDLRCASLSAFESGIFELLGQLYTARLLFFAVEKK